MSEKLVDEVIALVVATMTTWYDASNNNNKFVMQISAKLMNSLLTMKLRDNNNKKDVHDNDDDSAMQLVEILDNAQEIARLVSLCELQSKEKDNSHSQQEEQQEEETTTKESTPILYDKHHFYTRFIHNSIIHLHAYKGNAFDAAEARYELAVHNLKHLHPRIIMTFMKACVLHRKLSKAEQVYNEFYEYMMMIKQEEELELFKKEEEEELDTHTGIDISFDTFTYHMLNVYQQCREYKRGVEFYERLTIKYKVKELSSKCKQMAMLFYAHMQNIDAVYRIVEEIASKEEGSIKGSNPQMTSALMIAHSLKGEFAKAHEIYNTSTSQYPDSKAKLQQALDLVLQVLLLQNVI